jgi:hypothetical protein
MQKDLHVTPELLALKQKTIGGMVSYMKFGGADDSNDPAYDPTFDAGYTQKHIDSCAKIIDEFFASLEGMGERKNEETITAIVKSVVVKLNKLNAKSEGNLLETDQREDLCDLVLCAAKQAGLESNEDVTEEWREW